MSVQGTQGTWVPWRRQSIPPCDVWMFPSTKKAWRSYLALAAGHCSAPPGSVKPMPMRCHSVLRTGSGLLVCWFVVSVDFIHDRTRNPACKDQCAGQGSRPNAEEDKAKQLMMVVQVVAVWFGVGERVGVGAQWPHARTLAIRMVKRGDQVADGCNWAKQRSTCGSLQ